ncbi:MAG TPA: hypothetical protein VLA82_14605 [Actinomycetota bacterium]|nr:hypothetical protein [Actinomycetota bacterium]
MTRYLCAHPSHGRGDERRAVDVTAQVRLERRLPPRATAYLAVADDVVNRVARLRRDDPIDRRRAINHLLTGDPAPRDAVVLLVASDRISTPPGLYELDALRADEPAIDRLIRREGDAPSGADTDEVLVLEDVDDDRNGSPMASAGVGTAPVLQRAPSVQRTERIPEGIYRLSELSSRLADAGTERDDIVDALRAVPRTTGAWHDRGLEPWRVVVECPVAEGDPPRGHRVVFAGDGRVAPGEVFGVPLSGREALYEDVAATTWAPATSLERVERRLRWSMIAIAAASALIAATAWITGALGFVAREEPWLLAAAVVCLTSALAVGAFTLARPAGQRANLNDTLVVRRATRDQVVFTEWMTGAVAVLAALALVFGVIAPILLLGRGEPSVPAPSVTFQQGRSPVAATVAIAADDVASDETMWVEMRTFGSAEAPATLIARMSASGDREGRIDFVQTVAVNPRAAFFSVLIWFGDDERPTCTPTSVSEPGCTVLAVPRSQVQIEPLPVPVPGPEVEIETLPTPSPGASPTVAPSPSPPTVTSPTPVSPGAAVPSLIVP